MIQPQKLAAIDLALLGPKFVIAEFVVGVVAGLGVGWLVLARGHGSKSLVLGLYLLSLGLNYVPMAWCAVDLTRKGVAIAEIEDELKDRGRAMRKYRRQSLWLLVPLVTVVMAFVGDRSSRRERA
jgi:hypothetical protein